MGSPVKPMVCASCGFHNPPEMRFCGNCGARLVDASHGQPPAAGPADAGQVPLKSAPAADPETLGILTGSDLIERFRKAGLEVSGQRRNVTVLFVDLSGYTQLSESLPDEELYELVQKFIRLLVHDVHRYEGMVDKLTGDGLMALFGAPIAHENNAERAIRCALDMAADVARLGEELDMQGHALRIHAGLNGGSVIVGGVGGDGLMNYTAIGDSVNLARRLEESAPAGSILASESVYRQASRLFDFEPLPPLSLKNVSNPVSAFRVLSAKAQPSSMRGIDGLRAPMIGRELEFCQVKDRVDRLASGRTGGVILLVGEGGMGKSRLTAELKAALDGDRLAILEGQSLTYRKSIAYWIFQDMLRRYMGIAADAPGETVRDMLAKTASAVLGERAREALPYLEHLFSFQPSDLAAAERIRYLDPGQLRQQVFLALRDFLLGVSHLKPLLIILEDLHWADDASLDLIRFLVDGTRSAPVLLYAITRPFEGGSVQAIQERAQQRLGDQFLLLRLQALPPEQSAQLLQALLSIQDLPDGLREQIIERSAGLPFYLEEILRMLIERKIIFYGEGCWQVAPGVNLSSIGVPETLQGLILARFDRLSLFQRRLLQTASVVGYQFSSQVLSQVLLSQVDSPSPAGISKALEDLTEREFILPLGAAAGDEDTGYQFRHALVSDAVYSTLLQRDRRELHTQVGEAIEIIFSGRLDGYIEVLASHFLRSPHLDRALHYLILSGEKAARSYANAQSLQLFRQALELLSGAEHTQEQAMKVHNGLGDALVTAGEYSDAREHYISAMEALGVPGRTGALPGIPQFPEQQDTHAAERIRLLSQLQRKISKTLESQGEYDKALVYLQSAQSVLRFAPAAFAAEQASSLNDTGWIFFRRGSLDQAENVLLEGLSIAEQSGQKDVTASILNRLAGIYYQRDAVDQASFYMLRSLRLREEIGDVVAVARSYNNLGLLSWKQGLLQEALKDFNRSFQLQANLGDVEGQIVLHTNMGLIEIDRGNLQESQEHFQEALETAGQIGHFYHVCLAQMHLALLNVYAGNWAAALEFGQLSLAGFQELGVTENLVDLNVSLGWAYLGLGDEAHGSEIRHRLLSLLGEENSTSSGPSEGHGRAYRLFARFDSRRGDLAGACENLEKSAAIFAQSNSPLERSRSLVELGNLLAASGETDRAKCLFAEARQVFDRMGARVELSRLEQIEQDLK